MAKNKKIHTAAGSRKLYNRILVSAYKIGRGITPELVWRFLKPDEFARPQSRYYETDYLEMARVLSVFGVKQTVQYPFSRFRSAAAVAALAINNRRRRTVI